MTLDELQADLRRQRPGLSSRKKGIASNTIKQLNELQSADSDEQKAQLRISLSRSMALLEDP